MQSGLASNAPALKPYQLTVEPGKEAFRIELPEGWKVSDESTSGITTIHVRPGEGDAFDLLLSVVRLDARPAVVGDPWGLQVAMQRKGSALLPMAMERELKLIEVRSGSGLGYFFKLTDNREEVPRGEFGHWCHGIMAMGQLHVTVTFLRRNPDEALLVQVLSLLRKARSVSLRASR